MKLLLNIVLFISLCPLHAQIGSGSVKELKVGDTIPDIVLKDVRNSAQAIRLSDYRGKFLLLDFWSTHCSACIGGFPKMDTIQNKFKDSLKVILIDIYENSDLINSFAARWQKLTGHTLKNLSMATGDTTLHTMFYHEGVPFYVLIDPAGKILGFPETDQVTEKNIGAILHSQKAVIAKKAFRMRSFNGFEPLFINNNGGDGKGLLYYSVLSKKVEGLPASIAFICDSGGCKLYDLNDNIRGLYQFAFYDGFTTNEDYKKVPLPSMRDNWLLNNRTELDVKDTTKLVAKVNGGFVQQNRYCYQLLAKKSDYMGMKRKMQEDLQMNFGLHARFVQRLKTCLVFSTKDSSLCHATGNEKSPMIKYSDLGVEFSNAPFQIFIYDLAYSTFGYSPFPIIDDTGIKGNVTMKFEANMNDWKSIARALKEYKIDLKLEQRKVNVLILSQE